MDACRVAMETPVRAALIALLASLGLGAVAQAATPPPAVRQAVQAELDTARAEMVDPDDPQSGPPKKPADPKMFTSFDLNGDGVADWRVNYENSPWASLVCGTGGCQQQVYVSRPDGSYALVFDTQAREFKTRKVAGRMVIDVDFHGSVCGGFGVEPCPRRFGWSAADQALVELPNAKGDTRLRGLARVIGVSLDEVPAPAAAYVAERVKVCTDAGGSNPTPEDMLDRTPDLDGDGKRDFAVQPDLSSCGFNDEGEHDFVSAPVRIYSADGRLLLETPGWLQFDIATAPARLIVMSPNDDCEIEEKTCPVQAYVFDAAAHRLVPAR